MIYTLYRIHISGISSSSTLFSLSNSFSKPNFLNKSRKIKVMEALKCILDYSLFN